MLRTYQNRCSVIYNAQSHLTVSTKRDDSEGSSSELAGALVISATSTGNSSDGNGNETPVVSEIFDADITNLVTSDASTNSALDDILTPQVSSESVDSENSQPTPQDSSSNLSVEDIFALTVKFTLNVGLPWKGIEALQQLIVHILDRHDILTSKYVFKKHVGVGVLNAHFDFYCSPCMNPVAETSGDLIERNRVKVTCSVCMKSLTGRQIMVDGNFFITLPVEQLSSLLTNESVANALHDGLNSIA